MSIAARYSGSAGPLVVRVVLSENHPVAMERSHLQISPNGATKSESCDREKNRWLVCVESCNGEDVCHVRGSLFSALSIRGVCFVESQGSHEDRHRNMRFDILHSGG